MPKPSASASRRAKRAPIEVQPPASPPPPVAPASGPINNYQAAVKFLYDRVDVERSRPTSLSRDVFKLDRMRRMLELLGNPHESIRCVHVAGTKGKGSTCEMTASCLEACGYTVGIYTSPHLVDVRERVRINRKMIPHPDFTRIMARLAEVSDALPVGKTKPSRASGPSGGGRARAGADGPPTFFELITAAAFVYSAEQAVDVAVSECGLGGRLDSTNVIIPEVCAITSISLDHTQLLGDTLEEIAREKAGVFKPGVPVVTVQQPPGVLEVFREVAAKVGAPLHVVGEDIDFSLRFESSSALGPHARVCLTTERNAFEHLPVPLKGEHQAYNCGLALAILDKLCERGFQTPESKVTRGLERVECPGRLEMAWDSPRIVLDGAHTPDSVWCLMKAIGAHVAYDSMVVIFGCAADKDARGMLEHLALGADKVIFTRAAGNARAADPRELQRHFTEICGKVSQTALHLGEALDLARRAVGRDDLICITGSFYLIGDAKKHLKDLASKRTGAGS